MDERGGRGITTCIVGPSKFYSSHFYLFCKNGFTMPDIIPTSVARSSKTNNKTKTKTKTKKTEKKDN